MTKRVRKLSSPHSNEETAKRSVSFYRAAIESLADGILVLDRKGEITDFNQKFVRMWSIPSKVLGSRELEKVLSRISTQLRDPEVFINGMRALCNRPYKESLDLIYLKNDRIFECYSKPQWIEGQVIGWVLSFRDVTERVKAETESRKLGKFLESVIEGANVWMNVLDRKGNIVLWNRAAEEISGYSREEVLGHGKIWEWIYPDEKYRKENFVATQKIIRKKGAEEKDVETTIRCKNGLLRTISWYSRNLVDEDENLIGSIVLGRDITDQKRAESERERLLTETERLAKEQTVLNELSGALTARLSVEEVLEEAYLQASRLVDTTNFYVALYQSELDEISFVLSIRDQERQIETRCQAVKGFTGYIIETRTPLLIEENVSMQQKELGIEAVGKQGSRSWLGVPILIQDRVLGVMAVQSFTTPYLYDEHDQSLLAAIASSTAIALQNAQLYEEIQQKLTDQLHAEERLAIIHTLGQKLVLARDVREIARSAVEAALKVLSIPICGLWLVDQEQKMLIRWAQTPGTKAPIMPPFPVHDERGIIALVVRTGESIYIADVSKEPRYVGGGFRSQSELCVPLRVGNHIIGALNAESERLDAFNPADMQLLEALANAAAIAIENARLFHESQRRAEEIAALREVNLAILSTLERDQFFKIMLDQLGKVIDYDNAAVKTITLDCKEKVIAGKGPIINDKEMWNGFDASDSKLLQEMRKTRRPVVVHDSHTDERYKRVGDWKAFRSWAGAPLFVRNNLVGYLMVEKTSRGFFDEKAVQLLADFAQAAAIALENVRLYESIRLELAERKRAQEALKLYAERLKWSNCELEEFAYMASHDLQEPLRKVEAFGKRLKLKYGKTLDEQGRDYIQRMQSAVIRMQNLINGLLTYARITTKGQPFVSLDLDKVVREVLSDLELRIEHAGGRIEVGKLPSIEADPIQIRQLLQNIIGNALKFARDEVPPVVKIGCKLLNGRKQDPCKGSSDPEPPSKGAQCQISVEDNGIGFDKKYLDHVFQVFKRLHGRDQYEGSGVGLATCRKIVERHNGNITARSSPGKGATFIITLPVKQQEEKHEGGEIQ